KTTAYLFDELKNVDTVELEKRACKGYVKESREVAYRYVNEENPSYEKCLKAFSYMHTVMQNPKYSDRLLVRIVYARILLLICLKKCKGIKVLNEAQIVGLDKNEEQKELLSSAGDINLDTIVAIFTLLSDKDSKFELSKNERLLKLYVEACNKFDQHQSFTDFLVPYAKNRILDENEQTLILQFINLLRISDDVKLQVMERMVNANYSNVKSMLWLISKSYAKKLSTLEDKKEIQIAKCLSLVNYVRCHLQDGEEPKNYFLEFKDFNFFEIGKMEAVCVLLFTALHAYSNRLVMSKKSYVKKLLLSDKVNSIFGIERKNFYESETYVYAYSNRNNPKYTSRYVFKESTLQELFKICLDKCLYEAGFVISILLRAKVINKEVEKILLTILKDRELYSQVDYINMHKFLALSEKNSAGNKKVIADTVDIALSISNVRIDDKLASGVSSFLMSLVVSNDVESLCFAYKLYDKYKSVINLAAEFKEGGVQAILDNAKKLHQRSKSIIVSDVCNSTKLKMEAWHKQNKGIDAKISTPLLQQFKNVSSMISSDISILLKDEQIEQLLKPIDNIKKSLLLIESNKESMHSIMGESKGGNIIYANDVLKQLMLLQQKISAIDTKVLIVILDEFKTSIISINKKDKWKKLIIPILETLQSDPRKKEMKVSVESKSVEAKEALVFSSDNFNIQNDSQENFDINNNN
ncbi:MAG: hypothetical protein COB50_03630, partial [Thiotrichales bacterium]